VDEAIEDKTVRDERNDGANMPWTTISFPFKINRTRSCRTPTIRKEDGFKIEKLEGVLFGEPIICHSMAYINVPPFFFNIRNRNAVLSAYIAF